MNPKPQSFVSRPPFKERSMESRYQIIGDLTAPTEMKDVTNLFRDYSETSVKDDERIILNWRVIYKKTGRTVAVFGGGAAYDAASVFQRYCEENYKIED